MLSLALSLSLSLSLSLCLSFSLYQYIEENLVECEWRHRVTSPRSHNQDRCWSAVTKDTEWGTSISNSSPVIVDMHRKPSFQTMWIVDELLQPAKSLRAVLLHGLRFLTKQFFARKTRGSRGFFFWMEEGWNLIIYIKFGVCNFSTVGFMKFTGGSREGGGPRATPEGCRGVNFSGMEEG